MCAGVVSPAISNPNPNRISEIIMQLCVFHRCPMSPLDAMFCTQVGINTNYKRVRQ